MDDTITTADDADSDPRPARRRRRAVTKLAALGLAAGLFVALAACGDDDDTSASSNGGSTTTENEAQEYGSSTTAAGGGNAAAANADATLEITEMQYNDVTAPAGGTLAIENETNATHTFTSDDDAWDEVEIAPGDTATIQVPDEAGDFDFHCEIHSNMQATLTAQ
jgi:plastocyanin